MMNSVGSDDGRARERQAALVVARRLVHALARLAEDERPRRPAVVRALEDGPYGFVRDGLAVDRPSEWTKTTATRFLLPCSHVMVGGHLNRVKNILRDAQRRAGSTVGAVLCKESDPGTCTTQARRALSCALRSTRERENRLLS